MANYYIQLSESILNKEKLGENTWSLRRELNNVSFGIFQSKINTDELKNIFWSNIYNEFFLRVEGRKQVETATIFKVKMVKFSGYVLSLNDIEFGILGTKKINLGFYELSNPFYPSYIRKLAVEKFDKNKVNHLIKSTLNTICEV